MPIYSFTDQSGSYAEHYFPMSNAPSIGATVDIEGVKWTRIVTKPDAAVGVNIDPFDKGQFVRSLEGKNETLGSTWDRSAELSERRAAKNGGVDPVKQAFYDNYAKARHGQRHPKEQKELSAKRLKEMGVSVRLNH